MLSFTTPIVKAVRFPSLRQIPLFFLPYFSPWGLLFFLRCLMGFRALFCENRLPCPRPSVLSDFGLFFLSAHSATVFRDWATPLCPLEYYAEYPCFSLFLFFWCYVILIASLIPPPSSYRPRMSPHQPMSLALPPNSCARSLPGYLLRAEFTFALM